MFLRSIFLFCCTTILLYAHPHIFVDAHVEVQNDKIFILWSFDEMTSSILMSDYDKNKDKKLDDKEIAFMKKDHFDSLAPLSYFLHFFDGEKEQNIIITNDFSASFENNKLIYIFSIPKPKLKQYELRFYDADMYLAIVVKPEFLTCKKPSICVAKGYDADYYYGYKVIIQE